MTPRILHLHSTFAHGGKEARAVRLMNAWGQRFRHTVVSAMPDQMGAADAIAGDVPVEFPADAPPLAGRPTPARLRALAAYQRGFDLVLTYNWGALDAVMAHRLFGWGGPPLIHHEDGFGADEARRTKRSRDLYRRVALTAARAVVVPSATLERIARARWGVAEPVRIANGVAVCRFAEPTAGPWPTPRGERVRVTTVAGLRAVKNLPRLVRAVAPLDIELVIAGEGPERATIEAEADRLGLGDRLRMPGFLADPARLLTHADVFALSSDSEQFPISVAEAMAAGLPVAATDVGDVRAMVSEANRPFVVADEAALARAIATLAADDRLRQRVGEANRSHACAHYDERTMIERYADLYGAALRAARDGRDPAGRTMV